MKLYMYSHENALKNDCQYKGSPIGKFLIFLVLFIIFLFFAIFVSAWVDDESIASKFVSFLLWIGLVVFSIIFFKCFLKDLRMKNWAAQTAFIKDRDTLWAVKLTYIHFPVIAIDNNLLTTASTLPIAKESADTNIRLKKEIEERKVFSESYKEALIDAQGNARIIRDVDKNFTFIFNGNESVIRLDDIKFIEETDKTEVYTYKNYKGRTTKLEVIKAYPGLRDEVFNTKAVKHELSFPKNYNQKISRNPLYVFLIILFIILLIMFINKKIV